MSTSCEPAPCCVALIGNPNTGKSTLFSALVGIHQRVGNYPGVTVEKKAGQTDFAGRSYTFIDLPGLYSLAPRSRDEMVAVDVLVGRQADVAPVDVVLSIVDAGNIERNLYLVSQVLDLGLPTVLALNMLDVATARDVVVDVQRLEQQIGIPVIAIQANRGAGIDRLKEALAKAAAGPSQALATPMPEAFEAEVTRLESLLHGFATREPLPRPLVQRLLLDTSGYLQRALLPESNGAATAELTAARKRLARAGHAVPGVETDARYGWIGKVLRGVVALPANFKSTPTDRLDRVLTHRFWGTLLFALVMLVMFQAVFVGAKPFQQAIDGVAKSLGASVALRLAPAPCGAC